MNEKELRKLIIEKRSEMEAAQKAYLRVHYDRQLTALSETLANSQEVLDLINEEELTKDDCVLLAGLMSKRIKAIYRNFSEIIEKNKSRRKNKNLARNERRHQADIGNNTADVPDKKVPAQTTRTIIRDNTATDIRKY